MSWLRLVLAVAPRALVNPALAVDLLRVGWRFRRRHWWRRAPFLPVPAREYVRWRMYTAYGDEAATSGTRTAVVVTRTGGTNPVASRLHDHGWRTVVLTDDNLDDAWQQLLGVRA